MNLLQHIHSPQDLKQLSYEQLETLCAEIRSLLIDVTSRNGGHLAPNLGVVELTEADVITGRTVIPAMKGFSIEILSIYDRAETLIPQIMLVVASVWCTLPHLFSKKNKESK